MTASSPRPLIGWITSAPVVVGALIVGAATLAASFAIAATSWAVMTDELQIVRLATNIAQTFSPVPRIHGEYYGALSQLYPLLVAPFYGLLTAPSAETAAHTLNSFLLPSAAWPAFLLARSVTGSRAAGFSAAALTALTPWLVLTSTLLTENAAYPAFVWGVFLCHRALFAPMPRRDVGALGALLLVFLARTQLLVLAVALPIAIVCHEVGIAIASEKAHSLAARMRRGATRAVRLHSVLAFAYGIAAVAALALIAVRSLGAVVGNYRRPFSGDLLPTGLWSSAAAHVVQVVVGSGVLPFVLAIAWSVTTLLRPGRKEAHAFASLLAVLLPLLTFEVTSFDLRFSAGDFIQDRYLFYAVPLLAVAAAAALVERSHLLLRVGLLAVATGVFVGLLQLAVYDDDTIVFWASPAAAFHPALVTAGRWLGLSAEGFIAVTAAVVVAAVTALLWRLPRAGLVCASAGVAVFGAFEAGYVFNRFAEPTMTRGNSLAGEPRDWIDRVASAGRSVALVPSPQHVADYWWEAELWNRDVDHVLRVDGGPTFTPFPATRLSLDFEGGTLRGSQPSSYLVLSESETRFGLFEARRLADTGALRLVRVERPYRLAWALRGVTADGWAQPELTATLRLYGRGRAAERVVSVLLSASRHAGNPVEFAIHSNRDVRRGGVDPGGARPPVDLHACVPASGHTDITFQTRGTVQIPDGRRVTLHLDQIEVRAGKPCRPAQLSSR